ncbi:MAG: hypothetical protein H0T14_03685 [Nocardioidaceae bacterium]|nr:hypothetical protein [Nocardioidaceae bacterium]
MEGSSIMRKIWVTLTGWVLLVVGVVALPLPGPGLLILLTGLVVLSQEYEWAERRVEPVKQKAFDVAETGVATYPRIVLSGISASAVIATGVVWGMNDVTIPEIGPLGPRLPLGGWSTGSGIVLSGLVAWGLLLYSIKRFRPKSVERQHASRAS